MDTSSHVNEHGEFRTVLSTLRNRILTAFPDINMLSSRLISSGWDSHVILVNNRIAFKFPKRESYSEILAREISLLKAILDCPVRVPNYRYVSGSGTELFGGYDFINGEPLNSVKTLTDTMKEQFVQLLNYLFQRTGILLESGKLLFSDHNMWRDRYRQFYREIREKLSGSLGSYTMMQLENEFKLFLATYSSSFKTSLTHGDLYRGNVIINPEKGRIHGIIDWGDCLMGDPALDLAAIAVDFPYSEIEPIVSEYTGEMDEYFTKRMEFYWKIEPLYGLLHYSEKQDEEQKGKILEVLNSRLNGRLI